MGFLTGLLIPQVMKAFQNPNDPSSQQLIEQVRQQPAATENLPPTVGSNPAQDADTEGGPLGMPLGRPDARLSQFSSGSSPRGLLQGDVTLRGGDYEKQQGPPNWLKQGLIGLQGGIGGYLSAAHPGYRPSEGGIVQRWKDEQMDALKRRHAMWEGTYDMAQKLPSAVLTDPRLSSLASAKQALDKDMMDGKIDNEKNVSNFLTELQRHKADVDALGQAEAIKQQVGMTTGLAKGYEQAGITPQGERTTQVSIGGKEFRLPEHEAAIRAEQQEKNEQAAEAAKLHWQTYRDVAGQRAGAERARATQAAADRDTAQKTTAERHTGTVARALLSQAAKQIAQANPDQDPTELHSQAAQAIGEQLMMLADQEGLVDESGQGYEFQGQTFPATSEGIAQLDSALANFYTSR